MMEVEEGPLGPAGLGPPGANEGPHSRPTGFYSQFFSSFQGAISRAETAFVREGVACGVRGDGRGRAELRPRVLAVDLLPFSCSSAAIQTEENTVIATVDADVILPGGGGNQEPYSVSVGCGAAEQELADVTGGDGSSLSSLLQAMLEQLLLPHLKPLTDPDGRLQWRISIDVIVLRAGGCLLDAVSLAIWGALKALKLPNVMVEEEDEKDQGLAITEYKVSCDERIAAGTPYPIDTVPILITAAQIGDTYVWDLTEIEATCGDSFLVAAFLPSGACVGLQKFGHVLADCRTLQTTLTTSQRLSREILEDLQRQAEMKKSRLNGNLDSFLSLASL
ncbi:exosome complex exonuclease, putative [Eimeria tenella]|uniref:Ribosomal RNA-processing protein 42 n=1 Tax=Eimeria tenella TaxID=5802 RepID=U6KH30_EIMTE|nr:exosome complex exonuclease, putative [Eimeria tenella]CDJ37259.1 exosome complex exonuclease, putative [Eimeria tenella]|eukprot:XP_013228097.1 exosome complex exonuclease, putative [Eimeria tenella]